MTLSRGLAAAIVDVVVNDPECVRRIDSGFATVFPDSLGIAGAARNFAFAFAGTYASLAQGKYSAQPTKDQDDLVCYGIRDATMAAIEKAIKTAGPGDSLKSISEVYFSIRDEPLVHTATKIVIANTYDYVFDWHATLNTRNPIIYPSEKDFEANKGSKEFASFTGFA